MVVSKRTKQCQFWAVFFGILHFVALFGPLLFFGIQAFIAAETVSKVVLGLTAVTGIIISLLSLIITTAANGLQRTAFWAIIIGIMTCLTDIKTFIWIIAIVSVADEVIFTPLWKRNSTLYDTNREIDLRFEQ